MAAAIDAGYIAASYSLPEPTIISLLDAPTVEHVKALLAKIEEKAREFENIEAEKLRSDVELETAVRSGNARAKQLKESAEKGLKEVEELRRKLAAEESARANVEAELQNLKSSSSGSASEVQSLHSRIASLESANRDAVALLESKSTAYDNLAEEFSQQQQKIIALRREASELEAKVQSAENASMQFKFREQHLQEEVELLKKRNEWNEEELKRRTGEHSKYRKEKTAQLAELQRSIEDVTQANDTLRSTETQLRNRLDEVTRKLEDAYAQLQNKDEELVRRENSSRAERDNALRLAELQKKSAETARARQQELERAMSQLKDDAASEIGELQADVNAERKDKEIAERRVQELEKRVDELQHEAASSAAQGPATPRRSLNGAGVHGTPFRPGSPLTPGASRLKAGMTMTQMVGEYSRIKSELESERRVTQELRVELDNMISDLENRQPEIEELRMDHGRLKTEIEEAGQLIEQANAARDAARKAARKWESAANGLGKERDLLQQQLRDFSTQIKLLLVELQSREQGIGDLTAEQQAQFESFARGELDDAALEGMSDTGRFISQRLVIFRNVAELQEQNQQLLHLTRKLGEEMEGEEARAKKEQQEKDVAELEELRAQVIEYKDTVQSLTTRSDSYIRERDMFRRMLAHRGQLPQGADMSEVFGSSFMPATPSRQQSTEPSSDARALADHIKLLKELQHHFDAYREESSTDQAALKRQNDALSREKSDLLGENARLMSKDAVHQERYNLLQSSYNMLKTENAELHKRTATLFENAAKQDLRTQQVAEELIEAKALAESMRNETANLKAERELWKRIETRLTEDNRSLMEERSRLNRMVSDLQSLQNERELADSESRRRLQSRVEAIEAELSSAKRKLDEEVEQAKKASLRREYESEQNRTRIDDLLKSASNYKEELIAVKTERDQLSNRVEELKIDLRNAEEKAIALQPRLTSRPTPGEPASQNDENALSREQELSIEVADLKRDLELKEAEIQTLQDEMDNYKAISQQAEEDLQQLNDASDQYRQETDAAIAEKDAKIQELTRRIEELSSELASTGKELSDLRLKENEIATKFNEQKNVYESELARLRDESDRLAETARLHQEDIKAQAEIAQQAQENYESELVKHAEAASTLQKLRSEYNTVKTELAGYRADAEAAKMSLTQSEESWADSRAKYEQEITEMRNSREELKAQNKRLHTQLEDLSTQIANLKVNRAAASSDAEESNGAADPTSNNLQEIVRYLRQEKEIVDMQYELQMQESKRLQQQLEHANHQVEETREKLEQERRSHSDQEQQATSHSKLIQTINELNLFRESNSSLRNQARSAQEQLARKIKEVEDLTTQLEPVKAKARETEYELEAKLGEIRLLQEDRDRWQKRTQDIMQKYDRVDPAELQELRDRIDTLMTERDAALAEVAPLKIEIEALPGKTQAALDELNKSWEERRAKLVDQSKNKVREMMTINKERTQQLEAANANIERLSQELEAVKKESEAVKGELETTKAALAEAQQQARNGSIEEGEAVQNELSDSERAIIEAQVNAAEQRAAEQQARADALEQEANLLRTKVEELEAQIVSLGQQLEKAKANSTASEAGQIQPPAAADASEELARLGADIERSEADLAAARKEIDALKAAQAAAATKEGSTGTAPALDEGLESRRAQLESEYADKTAMLTQQFQLRADKMKQQLNDKLKDKNAELAETKAKLEGLEAQVKTEPVADVSSTAAATSEPQLANAPTTNGTAKPDDWQPSDTEVRQLLQTNVTIQRILKGNIEKAVAQKLEASKAEDAAAMEKAVADAKTMAEKRSSIKINMAENKAKTLGAQIEVVKQAVVETPERAVKEVWDIASKAKAGGAMAVGRQSLQPGSAPASGGQQEQKSATANTAQTSAAQATPAATGTSGIPSAAPAGAAAGNLQRPPPMRGSHAAYFGAPSHVPQPAIGNATLPVNPFTGQHAAAPGGRGQQPSSAAAPAAPKATGIPAPASVPTTGIPQPGGGGGGGGGAGGGRGGAAGRGGSRGSSLPRSGGRGNGNGSRGGGSNIARGNQGGRGRGGMNPSAAGFTPGAGTPQQTGEKRPNDGSGGGDEKRVRPEGS